MFTMFVGAINIWLGLLIFRNPEEMAIRMNRDEYHEIDDNDILKMQFLGVFVVGFGIILALVGLSTFF
ncbi:hypothetical protein AAXB25_34385 [Paenibacillus lautus]|jgi:hypothetical protein|uniref:hypothetical protein n=1 Tax=Paenibacillus TaxID=44249 RepID=UPI001B1C0BB2|nr:hypothetical protein [Paenibacillus lautus]GIO99464.1 hypothetical protein J14TS5_45500 [Paenibacillus lautus]